MSTKTLRKRIALVATLALGTGVLSVAPANAASILAGELAFSSAVATTPGLCYRDLTSGAQSVVLVSGSSVTMLLTQAAGTDDVYVSVAGPLTISSASANFEAVTLTTATNTSAVNNDSITFTAGAVGSATISIKGSATGSTLEVASVTVVASCVSNKLSIGDSYVQVRDDAGNADSNIDEATGLVTTNASTSYVALALKDAYGNALSGAGVLAASATNGAVVSWDGAASVQSSVAYLSTRGAAGTELNVVQGVANADKPLTTTISITLDGAAVATKTITFQGVPAKITITNVLVGKVGSTGIFDAKVEDSAGNALASKTVADDALANSAAEIAAIASISTSAVTGSDGSATSATVGTRGAYSCVKSGKATINVKTVISSVAGTSVKTSFPITCGGVLNTWTISMNKASYAPGEIATLTVSGLDSKGFPVNSTDTQGTVEYSFGGLTAVTAPVTGDKFNSAAGVKTYTFSVGTTEGAFVGTYKIAGATDTSAKTVQYAVAAPVNPAVVSNAQVLQSIVALIASINKQIQALQALILKKK